MIVYKIDVLQELKNKGYNTGRLRREKILPEKTLQDIRNGKIIGMKSLNIICGLLDYQPGTIIKYVPDGETTEK